MTADVPRLVIAGLGGDSGKTLLSLGLLAAWREATGVPGPVPFKKGPDYIDAAWLGWAAGVPCRNLDTYLQPPARVVDTMRRHGAGRVCVVEGNRGLLDGADAAGTHSTAALARLLRAPVVLVVSAVKVTRTVAAAVAGCRALEPGLDLAGVVLNRVSGARHDRVCREAIEELCGVPVLGAVRRQKVNLLPDRHLGLVTPVEHPALQGVDRRLAELVAASVDLEQLRRIALRAPPLPGEGELAGAPDRDGVMPDGAAVGLQPPVRIGVFRDSAFTFYYPENLEALAAAGAEMVPVSSLEDPALPPGLGGLYLGGGFPETHADRLARNRSLMVSVKDAAEAGMPVFAECGGMIYLSRSLSCGNERHAMAGVLPLDLTLFERPQGHGYVELLVDGDNPLFASGTRLRGHEFHYTAVTGGAGEVRGAFRVLRGKGALPGRDGVVYKNVVAGYTHLHAAGVPGWAPALVRRAAAFGRTEAT